MKDDKRQTINLLLIEDKPQCALKIIQNFFENSNYVVSNFNKSDKFGILEINNKKVNLFVYKVNADVETINLYLKDRNFHAIAFVYNIKDDDKPLSEILIEELKDIFENNPKTIKAYVGFNSDNGNNEKILKNRIDEFERKLKNDQYFHYVVDTENISTLDNFFIGISKKVLEKISLFINQRRR